MTDTILIVDDDPGSIQLVRKTLANLATLRFATNGGDAVALAGELVPSLVLLDAQMPGMSGFKVFDALKAAPQLAGVPVIFVTSHSEPAFEVSALEMGAVDFIGKPVSPPRLLARVRTHLRLKHMADELRLTAVIDALTGVANRRQFDDSLEREWQRARRGGDPLALLFIDVDHFKTFNDHYGHPRGDACLKSIARAIQGALRRPTDFVARCGGGEFAVLLPRTARLGAQYMAQRIISSVRALNIAHAASPTAPQVTVSIGIAVYDENSQCFETNAVNFRFRDDTHDRCTENELVLAADKALYAAKHAGRAQVRMLDVADADLPRPTLQMLTESPRVGIGRPDPRLESTAVDS